MGRTRDGQKEGDRDRNLVQEQVNKLRLLRGKNHGDEHERYIFEAQPRRGATKGMRPLLSGTKKTWA
jgi:hypothetical protein